MLLAVGVRPDLECGLVSPVRLGCRGFEESLSTMQSRLYPHLPADRHSLEV